MQRKSRQKQTANWFVYLARCADGTLYCGISTNVKRRISQHNAGKGAKYIIASRRPVKAVLVEPVASHGDALRREIAIKKLSKKKKEALLP